MYVCSDSQQEIIPVSSITDLLSMIRHVAIPTYACMYTACTSRISIIS